MTGTDLVERLVGRHVAAGGGGRIAYVDPDAGEVSYRQLFDAAGRYAGTLRAAGIRPGSRGLIVADDSVATVAAVLGSWWYGCVPAPASPLLAEADIEYIVGDCAPEFVHVDPRARNADAVLRSAGPRLLTRPQDVLDPLREAIAGRLAPTDSADSAGPRALWSRGDEALLQYTSGSTGLPKGVRHSAEAIIAMLDGFGRFIGLRPEDRVLCTARMSFGYGFGSSVLCPLDAGAAVVLIRGPIDVHSVAAAARQHRPTVLCSVPRTYAGLLAGMARRPDGGFDAIRLCLTAGENCPGELADRIRAAIAPALVNCLGATEALHVVLATRTGSGQSGSLGSAVPGTTATVRDEHGLEVPAGTPGRLHVAGPTVALGYVGRDGARAFADGGLYTGDMVRRLPDGGFEYLCRSDDLLMLGGHKVAPREIEDVVRAAAGVGECAAVSTQDADGLAVAVVYAVAVPGADPDLVRRAIVSALRTGLPAYKRPSEVVLLPELPVTVTGKVAAHRLRTAAAADHSSVRK